MQKPVHVAKGPATSEIAKPSATTTAPNGSTKSCVIRYYGAPTRLRDPIVSLTPFARACSRWETAWVRKSTRLLWLLLQLLQLSLQHLLFLLLRKLGEQERNL